MQVQPPVYQGLEANDDLAAVRRRPLKSKLSRLGHIVSMYIPSVSSSDRKEDKESGEHTELLSTNSVTRSEFRTSEYDQLYEFKLLYSGENLVKTIVECIGTPLLASTGQARHITTIAADQHTIYVGLEELPYIFLLKAQNDDHNQYAIHPEPGSESSPIKGYIQLHVPRVGDLVPQELSVYSPSPESTVMYIVGWVRVMKDKQTYSIDKRWLLAKFSLTGQHLSRTPLHPYQRYSGLSVDTIDGRLLLTCPNLGEPQSNLCSDNTVIGQVCKLTPNFDRRVFSVTMGNETAVYRPDFIAQESAGHCCWASVERSARTQTATPPDGKPKLSRRLFAFPGRQRVGGEKISPRVWLHVVSWDFAELNPGRIVAFDAAHLLVIDATTGSLSYITWADEDDKPVLHRITRPGSNPIRLICSNYHATSTGDGINHSPIAYFVSGDSIFSFVFRLDSASA
ncbi:unnamed protein product [Dicrocoelium dendriticum]|nr:unnamed protein product [Dicrocoelium dendriticum]